MYFPWSNSCFYGNQLKEEEIHTFTRITEDRREKGSEPFREDYEL